MKDKLKERIENNRQDWDKYDTDLDGLWKNIDAQLNEKEGKTGLTSKIWLKIAASVALIAVAAWVTVSSVRLNDNSEELYALHDLSPELAETEYYYASQISEKLQIIHASNSDVNKLVLEDLSLLDSAYYDLQRDLKDNADSEEVINAMIQNYRIKLQILEKVLDEIRTKELKDEPDEVSI